MIFVIATIQTRPENRREVLKHFARVVPLVREEAGCQSYHPSVDLETSVDAQQPLRDDTITVVEQWDSVEALENHLMASHMVEFRTAVKDLVESVSLRILEPGVG